MNCSIVKKILFFSSLAGFETAFTFKEITEDVILKLEEFAQKIPQTIENYAMKLNVKLNPGQKGNLQNVFLGMHANEATGFQFKLADKSLILNIVNVIKKELEGNNSYDVFYEETDQTQIIVSTPIGKFFGDIEQKPSKKLDRTNKKQTDFKTPLPNDGNEPIGGVDGFDGTLLAYVEKLLRTSFCLQMRKFLTDYTEKNIEEMKFLEKCGLKSIEALNFSILVDDSNMKAFVQQCQNENCGGQLLAHIPCYCTRNSVSAISTYFRPKNKFQKILISRPDLELASKEINTCWLLSNYKRHLNSHSKFYCNEEIITPENSATNDEVNLNSGGVGLPSTEHLAAASILNDTRTIAAFVVVYSQIIYDIYIFFSDCCAYC